MNYAVEAVLNTFATELPDVLCDYEQKQFASDMSDYALIEKISEGTDLVYGDYLEYRIESSSEVRILKDLLINIAFKYKGTLDGISPIIIFEHTMASTGFYDIIKFTKPTILPTTTSMLSLILINSINITYGKFEVNMNPPYMGMLEGISINIGISTKYDSARNRIEDIEQRVIKYILTHHRKFDISTKGYFKLIGMPRIGGIQDNGDDYQTSTITLDGYYLLRF